MFTVGNNGTPETHPLMPGPKQEQELAVVPIIYHPFGNTSLPQTREEIGNVTIGKEQVNLLLFPIDFIV